MKNLKKLLLFSLFISPIALYGSAQVTSKDYVVTYQLVEVATKVDSTLTAQNRTLEENRMVLEQLSPQAKEQILQALINKMLDNQVEYPFIVPQGTNYSQLDMFFLLTQELMKENKELCQKLEKCIGETVVTKLGTRLNGCLDLLPVTIQGQLSPKNKKWDEQMRLLKKIQWRIATKGNPNATPIVESK